MADGGGGLCELFSDDHRDIRHVADADLFRILETWEECINGGAGVGGGGVSLVGVADQGAAAASSGAGGGARTTTTTAANARRREGRDEEKGGGGGGGGGPPAQKKQKGSSSSSSSPAALAAAVGDGDGAAKMSHITVERNRRKQMNEHLAVLRSLMPCFYVKRGDQASIIGGVVDYIKELQQVLRSLEAKKNRKAYADQVLSPRPSPAAALLMVKPTPPISPRFAAAGVPISPRTPTPGSPYSKHVAAAARPPHPAAATSSCSAAYSMSPAMTPTSSSSTTTATTHELSPAPFLPILDSLVTELAARGGGASCRPLVIPSSAAGIVGVPDVRVEFAGPNLVLKTVSQRAPGQALKIIAALESLSLEILHVSICTVDDATVLSFTIKIGIECELSAEELVQEIQQTFL
uniref:BHLH domain-containing protein n=1 Tax=Oryza meridionalis TaxID=40149 RepID=A0A0E0CIP0_9ORYZ